MSRAAVTISVLSLSPSGLSTWPMNGAVDVLNRLCQVFHAIPKKTGA